jgi:hypothetical protein
VRFGRRCPKTKSPGGRKDGNKLFLGSKAQYGDIDRLSTVFPGKDTHKWAMLGSYGMNGAVLKYQECASFNQDSMIQTNQQN